MLVETSDRLAESKEGSPNDMMVYREVGSGMTQNGFL